ncbi:hypothetical protein ABT052_34905 [Streptomyces sp. NPDC002766]|uniref:hypothetical protein n=1 Tax=Streptomyces sp. NPDC002766 TaxID=3154429 RepID=UPI0033249D99
MADPLFVFLVSGNPERQDDGFARCAWLRVGELVSQFFRNRNSPDAVVKADTVLRFIHFDCHTATVQIYEHDFKKQKSHVADPAAKHVARNWVPLDASFVTKFGPLDPQSDPKQFVEWELIAKAKASGSDHALSIVNVYHSVRKAPRGSVLELSIFSHAFVDGPVLFNTAAGTGDRRDPDDTDGRAATDFRADMGEAGAANANALDEFKKGFADTGTFRIWGCNIQDIVDTNPPPPQTQRRCLIMSTVREVVEASYAQQIRKGGALAQLLKNPKKLPPGSTKISLDMGRQINHERELQSDPHAGHGLTPFTIDRLFEIRYDEKFANHSYDSFFRGERDSKGAFAKVITRSLSDIVQFVAKETLPSYIFVAAQALKTVTVVGGAPGTSAELDSAGQQIIGPARRYEALFFSKFFGVSIKDHAAAVNRYYAFFDNQGNAVKTILDRAANGLP